MKHFKVTSALLAAIMCVTMVMAPVAADETEAPSETQTTEVADEKETDPLLLKSRRNFLVIRPSGRRSLIIIQSNFVLKDAIQHKR